MGHLQTMNLNIPTMQWDKQGAEKLFEKVPSHPTLPKTPQRIGNNNLKGHFVREKM